MTSQVDIVERLRRPTMRGVNYDDLHREAATLIESERKALAEAREALRPLAGLAWQPHVLPADDAQVIAGFANRHITSGDAKRARSLLQEPSDD